MLELVGRMMNAKFIGEIETNYCSVRKDLNLDLPLFLHLTTFSPPTKILKMLTLNDDEFKRYKNEVLQNISNEMIDASKYAR